MKKIGILILALALPLVQLWAQGGIVGEQLSCTSIIVGREASVDGSVITSHTCDGNYRTWLSVEPAREHPRKAKRQVYKNTMHSTCREDSSEIRLAGSIPEVKHTYAYLNTAYPCLNEKH